MNFNESGIALYLRHFYILQAGICLILHYRDINIWKGEKLPVVQTHVHKDSCCR